MKYAGNILRNFAQALAIVVGGLGSWYAGSRWAVLPRTREACAQLARGARLSVVLTGGCSDTARADTPPRTMRCLCAGPVRRRYLFGFVITPPFVGGVGVVIASIFLYGAAPEQLAACASKVRPSPPEEADELLAHEEKAGGPAPA